jgi:hypothetical protein
VPIQLKCPNGHTLSAKESNAGKTGKCPVCKASVRIPLLHQTGVSDSSIVRILGDPSTIRKNRSNTVAPARPAAALQTVNAAALPHIKLCPNCEREIDTGYHICPHCRTYITGLNDF